MAQVTRRVEHDIVLDHLDRALHALSLSERQRADAYQHGMADSTDRVELDSVGHALNTLHMAGRELARAAAHLRQRQRKDRRGRFAAAALQGLLSQARGRNEEQWDGALAAECAVTYADALIAELDREQP